MTRSRPKRPLREVTAQDAEPPVWTRPEPGSRRPRFSRAKIAAAALHVADREGIDAVSMRRVADELEAGTMTLYHYVRTKTELFALLTDAVFGELLLEPDEIASDWREGLSAIVAKSRTVLERHPWVLEIVEQPGIGPNGVRHFEQSLQAVAGLDLDFAARLDIIQLVDEYVFGFCMQQRDGQDFLQMQPTDRADLYAYLEQIVRSEKLPELSRLLDEKGMDSLWHELEVLARPNDRFERNFKRLLDGIELSLRSG